MSDQATLGKLRWDVDMDIVNHDGEHVWLGPLVAAEDMVLKNYDGSDMRKIKKGERYGVQDCCLVEEPCPRHIRFVPRLV